MSDRFLLNTLTSACTRNHQPAHLLSLFGNQDTRAPQHDHTTHVHHGTGKPSRSTTRPHTKLSTRHHGTTRAHARHRRTQPHPPPPARSVRATVTATLLQGLEPPAPAPRMSPPPPQSTPETGRMDYGPGKDVGQSTHTQQALACVCVGSLPLSDGRSAPRWIGPPLKGGGGGRCRTAYHRRALAHGSKAFAPQSLLQQAPETIP